MALQGTKKANGLGDGPFVRQMTNGVDKPSDTPFGGMSTKKRGGTGSKGISSPSGASPNASGDATKVSASQSGWPTRGK